MPDKKNEEAISLDVRAFNRGVNVVLKMQPLRNICRGLLAGQSDRPNQVVARSLRDLLHDEKESA